MTSDEFNAFCGSLPGTTHVVQWGGSDVWKVGGKLFAFCVLNDDHPAVTFKAGELAYEMLKSRPGLRPAPYLASRGLKWIQHYAEPGLTPAELQDYLRHSYRLVVDGLPKRIRASLATSQGAAARSSLDTSSLLQRTPPRSPR